MTDVLKMLRSLSFQEVVEDLSERNAASLNRLAKDCTRVSRGALSFGDFHAAQALIPVIQDITQEEDPFA